MRARPAWEAVAERAPTAARRAAFKGGVASCHGAGSGGGAHAGLVDNALRARLYALAYTVATPLFPILRRLAPAYVTTSEQMGGRCCTRPRSGAPKWVLETRDINAL